MKAYRCRRRFIAGKSAITVIPRLHGNISLGVFWCGAFAIEIFERCLWFWGMFFIVNKSAIRVTPSLPVYIRLEVFLPFFQGTFFPGLDYIVLLPLSSEVLLLSFKSTIYFGYGCGTSDPGRQRCHCTQNPQTPADSLNSRSLLAWSFRHWDLQIFSMIQRMFFCMKV